MKCDIRHTDPQVRKTRTNVRLALPSMVTQERPRVKQSTKIDDFITPGRQLLPPNSLTRPMEFTKSPQKHSCYLDAAKKPQPTLDESPIQVTHRKKIKILLKY